VGHVARPISVSLSDSAVGGAHGVSEIPGEGSGQENMIHQLVINRDSRKSRQKKWKKTRHTLKKIVKNTAKTRHQNTMYFQLKLLM